MTKIFFSHFVPAYGLPNLTSLPPNVWRWQCTQCSCIASKLCADLPEDCYFSFRLLIVTFPALPPYKLRYKAMYGF